jgi:hypothetical protein
MPVTDPTWRSIQKIAFRFFFVFLGGSSILCMDGFVDLITRFFAAKNYYSGGTFEFLSKPFYFLDRHLFHTGYNPKLNSSFIGDNHFGLVFYLTLLTFASIVTIAWTLLDRKRPNYNKLLYWFRFYIRYILAMTILDYGLDKLIPVQMSFPNVEDLMAPLGEKDRFTILWNFMGASKGYMMLTGIAEIMGSLFLFNRRTAVLGSLILLVILINVVGINIFYNIPVKMYATQLLIYDLFLLFPYSNKLIELFLLGRPVSLIGPYYEFHSKWKKYSLTATMIGIPLLIQIPIGIGIIQRYERNKLNAKRQVIYEVTDFIAKDTLPPLSTDTIRWKRFSIVSSQYSAGMYAIIYNMQDQKDYYVCKTDSTKRTITLKDSPDSLAWHVFTYANPSENQIFLAGKWKNVDIHVLMKAISIDSMEISKEKIKWVQD